MEKSLNQILQGYRLFRQKYAEGNHPVMESLADTGQMPEIMIVACSDSRVDPAVILQASPGQLFIVRNVANIVPPYEEDERHHGTSAALEFGVCYLKVKHLIIWGHSQCGGLQALLNAETLKQNDFITRWVSLTEVDARENDVDALAKKALFRSYEHSLTFPWIQDRVHRGDLKIHRWFFDIKSGEIFSYSAEKKTYLPLTSSW